MVNDPIGDLLTQIKNASMAGKSVIEVPYSKIKSSVCSILYKEGYINNFEKAGNTYTAKLRITLKYTGSASVITGIKRVSKPGLRWYVHSNGIPMVVGGMGITILSTPQGVMTGNEAKKKGIGGELLCTVW